MGLREREKGFETNQGDKKPFAGRAVIPYRIDFVKTLSRSVPSSAVAVRWNPRRRGTYRAHEWAAGVAIGRTVRQGLLSRVELEAFGSGGRPDGLSPTSKVSQIVAMLGNYSGSSQRSRSPNSVRV